MPKYNSDLYDDAPDMHSSAGMEEGMHDESKEHEDNMPEAVLPKSLMAGKDFKVGEEIVLEITRVGEEDFSVKYASEKPSDKKGGDEGEAEAMAPESAMSGANPGGEGMYG